MATEDSTLQPGTVPPPPAWLYQAMTEGLNAAQQGDERIPNVGRETLPPRAAVPGTPHKPAQPTPAKTPPQKTQPRKQAPTAPTVPGPATPPTARSYDFDEFSKSMEDSAPAAQVKKGIPIPVVDTGKKEFRPDWAPTISENLVEARVRIKAPDSDSTPIGAGATSGASSSTPSGTADTPASTPITGPFKPASWLAHEQDLRARRNAQLIHAIGALFVVACSFIAAGLSTYAEGIGFVSSRNIGNGATFVILLPFVFAYIVGKRWAGWVIFSLIALFAIFSIIATAFIAGAGPLIEFEHGMTITGVPVLGMIGNILWLVASALVFFGTPTLLRNIISAAGIILSGALMFSMVTLDFTPKLANPIIDARPSRLGDPALGFSYNKPEGYSGYRVDETAAAILTLTQHRPIPSQDIFLNQEQSLGFFHHLSNQGFGKEDIPPSMFALLDGAELLKDKTFEVNGATYAERRYRLPRTGELPEVVYSTVCTELEERYLHFTVLVHTARHGGTEESLNIASSTMKELLTEFEVDTPPRGRRTD